MWWMQNRKTIEEEWKGDSPLVELADSEGSPRITIPPQMFCATPRVCVSDNVRNRDFYARRAGILLGDRQVQSPSSAKQKSPLLKDKVRRHQIVDHSE